MLPEYYLEMSTRDLSMRLNRSIILHDSTPSLVLAVHEDDEGGPESLSLLKYTDKGYSEGTVKVSSDKLQVFNIMSNMGMFRINEDYLGFIEGVAIRQYTQGLCSRRSRLKVFNNTGEVYNLYGYPGSAMNSPSIIFAKSFSASSQYSVADSYCMDYDVSINLLCLLASPDFAAMLNNRSTNTITSKEEFNSLPEGVHLLTRELYVKVDSFNNRQIYNSETVVAQYNSDGKLLLHPSKSYLYGFLERRVPFLTDSPNVEDTITNRRAG